MFIRQFANIQLAGAHNISSISTPQHITCPYEEHSVCVAGSLTTKETAKVQHTLWITVSEEGSFFFF